MSFINDYSYTIRRSNKDIFYFYCGNGLFCKYYDYYNNSAKQINLLEDYIRDFTMFNFSIDKNDDIYGVICFDNLKIIKCCKYDHSFSIEDTLKFDFQRFRICYPYFKKINQIQHIFYYVYEIQRNNTTALFHMFKENNCWREYKIDSINHLILNEYKVVFLKDRPLIFYLNRIDNIEEIFLCIFDDVNHTWSNPIQITNTRRNKLYLDVAVKNNFIHIAYCYEVNDNYCIKYIRSTIENNLFKTTLSTDIAKYSAFMYPSFTVEDDTIFLMWVHLNKLYTAYSIDDGVSWSEPVLDLNSVYSEFLRSKFLSNYEEDLSCNDSNLFITNSEISFLGF